jgi:hypothetical protein
MELFIGGLKPVFFSNLKKLPRGCLERHCAVPSSAEIIGLLLFGGSYFYDENSTCEHFINAEIHPGLWSSSS